MPRYLIEVSHGDEHDECVRALRTIEQYGSHFFSHADWGCGSGVHCGWMIVELENKDEALHMLPPGYRQDARVVELSRFTKEQMESMVADLER